MHTQPQPTRSIPSPFADPAFIAIRRAAQDREARLRRLIECDTGGLLTPLMGSVSEQARLPKPALAYRILIRCALLAKEHTSEYSEWEDSRAIKLIGRMPDRGMDRLVALQAHVGKIVKCTAGADAFAVLPHVWREILPATYALTSAHWRQIILALEYCSFEKCDNRPSMRLLRMMIELRRTATRATR